MLADDIEGLAAIARATPIPVATGEHEYTKFGFKDFIARGGADIVQPDIGRVGGVTEWLKVAHLAHAFNLPVASHAYQLIHLHVACATPKLQCGGVPGRRGGDRRVDLGGLAAAPGRLVVPRPAEARAGVGTEPLGFGEVRRLMARRAA